MNTRLTLLITVAFACAAASAQQPTRPAPVMPEPLALDARAGFEPIFDGSSLKHWDGDPGHWRVDNGAVVGEATAEKPLKSNTFLIWRGGEPKDFELKLEYRISSPANSGIQYRSRQAPSTSPEAGRWVLSGYQADIDAGNRYTGQLYEERGRGFLALRGQATYIPDGQTPRVVGDLGSAEALAGFIKANDWNWFHIIARGNTLVHILNGHVMSMAVDDDVKQRSMGGLIGFQIHTGPPMKVEYRNIWLKKL